MTKQQLGLIGFPLSHSFSPGYFAEKFKALDLQDWAYDLFPLEQIADLPRLLASRDNWRGLNVTIPHKEAVIPYLSALSPQAQAVGAVNTIVFEQGQLLGYNTDVLGFEQLLGSAQAQKALILGTGGASKAVDYSLRKLGLETTYVSRNNATGILTYKDLNRDIISENTVIVNCTPSGMYPKTDECPEIPYNYISPNHLLYDVIYKPDETLFLKKGKEQRACTVNGMEMLNGQAIAAWKIWNS